MGHNAKKIINLSGIVIFLFCLFTTAHADSKIVNVGGYNFPPFVEKDGKTGMVQELIEKLNKAQSKYKFVFNLTSANRRYRDLTNRKIDAIFFEDEAWSWESEKIPYQKTGIILKGGEVYVALNKPKRDQRYFDSFSGKKVRAIFGYHYNFANMKTDPEVLRKRGISVSQSNDENVKDLLNERVDIIVINSFIVDILLKQDKDLSSKLLISEKVDQHYQLRILLNEKSPINASEIEKMVMPYLK